MGHHWVEVVRRAVQTPDRRPKITHMHAPSSSTDSTERAVSHPLLSKDAAANGDGNTRRPNMSSIINGYCAPNWVAKHVVYVEVFHNDCENFICLGSVIWRSQVLNTVGCVGNYGKLDIASIQIRHRSIPRLGKGYTARFVNIRKNYNRTDQMNGVAIT